MEETFSIFREHHCQYDDITYLLMQVNKNIIDKCILSLNYQEGKQTTI